MEVQAFAVRATEVMGGCRGRDKTTVFSGVFGYSKADILSKFSCEGSFFLVLCVEIADFS